ncbi:hypothetical protein [Afipia sp. DC4300-2b1]|uniref:hypothetical protein n=1 Tax=Afipia sp. DC4300-2b1 TaxID=2804672 RepID=UPI003CE82E95
MKTDAAVLLDLIKEMSAAVPANADPTYGALHAFNKSQQGEFDVIVVVNDSCGRLRRFIDLIPDTTDVHRGAFLSAIKAFENNFSLKNMGLPWKQFLGNIQTATHTQALHFLDYMIQSQSFWKGRRVEVDDAMELLGLLEAFLSELQVPDFIRGILLNDIAKLRVVLANYEKFGEQDYWDKFQKLTGLFGSIYTTLDENARQQATPIMQRMIQRVTGGLSISADVAQLATTAFALLPRV